MQKRLLITGAHGFIGSNLVEYLKNKYHIFSPKHSELELLNENDVRNYIKKNNIDEIIHCASVGGSRDTMNLKGFLYTNLKIFFNVVRNFDLVEKVIHLGSGAEYNKMRDLVNVDEEEFDESSPKDEYGFFKYICSKYIENNKNIVCLRLFGVYGKYENFKIRFISNSILKNLFKSPIVVNQNVYFSYLYVDDFVKIVEYFIEKKSKYKFYNATPDKKIDLLTISLTINNISGIDSKIILLNKGLNYEYTGSNKRLKREFPIAFTSYNKSIKSLIEYYKTNLHKFNKKEIIEDRYLKFCLTKK